MDSMVTSGSLGGVIVIVMARDARDVGSIHILGTIFPITITPTTIPLHACKISSLFMAVLLPSNI